MYTVDNSLLTERAVMDLDEILSAHSGEDKKVLIVLLLAYTNTLIKLQARGCGSFNGADKYYADMLAEYSNALCNNPWSLCFSYLSEISEDPYNFLFSIKSEFIKEFSDT